MYAFDKTTRNGWVFYLTISVSNLTAIYTVNDAISFGRSGDKLLQVVTNGDTINPNLMYLIYLFGVGTSTVPPTN